MSDVVVTTPGPAEIRLTRRFAAAPPLVFAAFTTPALLRRWFGARGWNLVVCEVDLRVGGAWRYVSRGPDGQEMGHDGTYRVVEPPGRLVFTEVYDDQSYPGETLIAHEFAAGPAGTELTSLIRYATTAGRDTVLRYPMVRGVTESFERLTALLDQQKKEVRP